MGKKNKKKRNKESSIKKPNLHIKYSNPVLNTLTLLFLLLSIAWGIFQQGYFFIDDSLLYQVLTCLILLVWIGFYVYNRQEPHLNFTPVLFLLIFVSFYGLSFFWAVNKVTAVEEFLKAANYLFVFLLASFIFKENKKPLFALFFTVIICGLLVVLVGVIFRTDPSSVTFSYFIYDRFFSLLQYPNATASFLMISFLLASGSIPLIQKSWHRCLIMIASSITVAGILLTYSRGIWVTLPFSCLLLLILAEKGQRLKVLLYMAGPAIASLSGFLITRYLQTDQYFGNILLLMVTSLISLLVFFVTERFLYFKTRTKLIIAYSASALSVILVITYAVISVGGPVKLAHGEDELAGQVSINQAIHETIEPDNYVLSFEVNTDTANAQSPDAHHKERIWQVKISGYTRVPHSTDIDEFVLYENYGGFYDNWTEKDMEFTVYNQLDRLEIEIISLNPETTVQVRNAALSFPDKKKNVSFLADRILPGSVYERFFSFSNIIAAEQRFVHSADALKIVADYPLSGAGGGSWETLYLSYTDREYYTKEIHNHTLKIWTDAGIIALLAYLAFFVFICRDYLAARFGKSKRFADKVPTTLYTVIFVVIVSVFAHSQIDFILSYGLFNILFFALAAAGLRLNPVQTTGKAEEKFNNFLKSDTVKYITGGFFLFLILLILSLNISYWNNDRVFSKAAELFRGGAIKDAGAMLERFEETGSYYDPAFALKAEVMEAMASESMGNREEEYTFAKSSLDNWKKAYNLAPFNPEYSRRLGLMKIQFGETREGLQLVEDIIDMHPYSDDFYRQVASVRLDLAEHYMGAGEDYDYARELLKDNIELEEIMFNRKGDTGAIAFYMGQTYQMLGDTAAAQSYYNRVQPEDDYYHEARDVLYRVNP